MILHSMLAVLNAITSGGLHTLSSRVPYWGL